MGTGRYDVIGEDDGRTYRDVPYIGDSPTGIVRRTSLISESGAELIINAEDLSRVFSTTLITPLSYRPFRMPAVAEFPSVLKAITI